MFSIPTVILLCKLGVCSAALHLGGQVVGNVHADIAGYQAILLAQQVTQQEYYRALTAYWNAQRGTTRRAGRHHHG